MKGDLSPFKRAIARDKSEFIPLSDISDNERAYACYNLKTK